MIPFTIDRAQWPCGDARYSSAADNVAGGGPHSSKLSKVRNQAKSQYRPGEGSSFCNTGGPSAGIPEGEWTFNNDLQLHIVCVEVLEYMPDPGVHGA